MMKLNSTLTFMALSALVSLVAACGGNTNSIQTGTDAPGASVLGANIDIKACQIGQSYSAQLGCLSRNTCNYGSGYSTTSGSCVAGTPVTALTKFGTTAPTTRHYGQLTVTNAQQFQVMLQASGVCGSTYGNSSYSITSSAQCLQYITRGSFAVVESYTGSADNINLMIGAGTTFPSDIISVLPGIYAGNTYGVVGSAYSGYGSSNYVSFNQQAHNYVFNNGGGMQLVGVSQGHPLNFMVVVNSGNLGLDSIDAQVVYQGTQVATVKLARLPTGY